MSKTYVGQDFYKYKKLMHSTPDIRLLLTEKNEWIFIDIAIPADLNITKTNGKIMRHLELVLEVKGIHQASNVTITYNHCHWCIEDNI